MITTIVKHLVQVLCLASQHRMRVALFATAGIFSASAPLLIKETVFSCRSVDRHPSDKSPLTSLLAPS